jgi:hypothetical protein
MCTGTENEDLAPRRQVDVPAVGAVSRDDLVAVLVESSRGVGRGHDSDRSERAEELGDSDLEPRAAQVLGRLAPWGDDEDAACAIGFGRSSRGCCRQHAASEEAEACVACWLPNVMSERCGEGCLRIGRPPRRRLGPVVDSTALWNLNAVEGDLAHGHG